MGREKVLYGYGECSARDCNELAKDTKFGHHWCSNDLFLLTITTAREADIEGHISSEPYFRALKESAEKDPDPDSGGVVL